MRNYDRVIVFDLETSGLDFKKDRIIEFGAVVLEKDENDKFIEVETLNYIVDPGFEVSEKITELTGITNEMIKEEGISEEELYINTKPYFFGDVKTLLIAYNVQFDITFKQELALRYGTEVIKFDLLDVMAVYKDSFEYPHRLKNAIEMLQLQDLVVNSHRASDDAKATWEVLKSMYPNIPVMDYVNQIGYNQKYGLSGIKLPHCKYYPVGWGKYSLFRQIKKDDENA